MITAQSQAPTPEAPGTPVRAVVASPYTVVRAGYRHMLERSLGWIVREAETTEALLAGTRAHAERLAVIDASLPALGGVDAVQRLSAAGESPGMVLCALRCPGELAARALNSGALACIAYDTPANTVTAACDAAARGIPFLTPDLMEQVALHRVQRTKGTSATLSPREFQVLRLIAEGKPHEEIAALLELSPRSVANYKAQLMRKLDVRTTAQLVHLAIRRGVIQSIV